MRLSSFALVSALVLSSMVPAQEGTTPTPTFPVAPSDDGVTAIPAMRLAFANRGTDATGGRLDLDANGACRHYIFLAVGASADVGLISSVAIMTRPLLVLPLAVYQGKGLETYPIIQHASIPFEVAIYLQGVAFPLAECGPAGLTATDVLRLFRASASDTAATLK